MTAPTLPEVAGWDVPLLRGAVWTLDSVAGALPAWRARVEAVGRSLEHADCWYGPAAQSAGAALVEVSTVATAVTSALAGSLEHAQRLLADADTAQELAEQALAAAAAVPVTLDGAGRLAAPLPVDPVTGLAAEDASAALRAEALAADALAAAHTAALAASQAADALAGLGTGGALAPATFDDLSWLVGVTGSGGSVPCPPTGGDPAAVAAWWASLSTAARTAAIRGDADRVGQLDGLPAWARDEANRQHLAQVLADPDAEGRDVAQAVAREIAAREAAGEVVQLYQFVPEDDLVALATGDVDTADAVAVVVPGIFTTPTDDLDDLADDATAVAQAAEAADPGLAVASIAWLGYRTPQALAPAATTRTAKVGGTALAAALDGLGALRGPDPARTTVVAHSYGTVVTEHAAAAPGPFRADALVLNGSPGLDRTAAELEVDEVYEATSASDYVTWLELHGEQTWESGFGAVSLPTDRDMGHTGYYDPEHPTLTAIGEVVADVREPG
ncbi:alpha/beta hydrolase [Geodermatophilus sp. DSM 45219]|uniref:alpha/beta hydrolase n=1 Tax=Geodermatophilus sp. DSM 45219 TaxID=1881103 RepID=UPI000881F405|nr:alpha/beta hydrolase [Geodermatophilus sp. DSM 45219]SDN50513.1 Alpha/beta hydrolase [Geodermatophilus sp. DSM 45219]